MTTWSRMTAEAATKRLRWARHDARPGSRGHRAGAVEKKQRRERGEAGADPRSRFPVTGAGPLRSGQDLTCSAILAGVAFLLSHRDHEPSPQMTATVVATAMTNRKQQRPATAHDARTIRGTWGYVRPD